MNRIFINLKKFLNIKPVNKNESHLAKHSIQFSYSVLQVREYIYIFWRKYTFHRVLNQQRFCPSRVNQNGINKHRNENCRCEKVARG